MEFLEIVLLSLIQGVTEFLPISSSAHLIFPSLLLGWRDQGLAFDVAVHFGTLFAVMYYLRHELVDITGGVSAMIMERQPNPQGRLGLAVLAATLPAGLAGMLVDAYAEVYLRSILVIAFTTLFFGLLLGWADKTARLETRLNEISLRSILIIGFAQMLALIPGTSRSGVTMTAALMLGLDRESSARFSFLLSVPLIAAIGLYKSWMLVQSGQAVAWVDLALGMAISAIVAFLCIRWFVGLVNRIGFMPFVIYRIFLGVGLFGLYYYSLYITPTT
jgi:undecaprenyl-diphosphatase